MPFLRRTSTLHAINRHESGFAGSKLIMGIGVECASVGVDRETLDELLLGADRAMYADKAKRKALFAESRRVSTNDLGQYRIM